MDAGDKQLSAREEELLGLLAGFPDDSGYGSDRELSFSDLVEARGATANSKSANSHATAAPAARGGEDHGKQHDAEASKQQQQARDRRPRRQRSGGRGSCGGSGDGVLLNFYVPGLRLTRSMTAPRPGRGAVPPPVAGGQAPAKTAAAAAGTTAGKARAQAPLGIGCWPALWGRGRDRPRTAAKACS